MNSIPDESVDCILTDPPYQYLKNQKLDIPFDETRFFNEVKRVLKPSGFIVMFGRGTAFYRWNTILADLGFKFKEEIIWDKRYVTSPLLPLNRVHETISLHCKGNGKINKVKVPYLEKKQHNIDSIIADIKRMRSVLHNTLELDAVLAYLEDNNKEVNCSDGCAPAVQHEMRFRAARSVSAMQAIKEGMNEKSIIKERRDHYATIHPTQKPVRLLERLLNLVCDKNALVLDPFIGSGSTAIACINTGRNYIGFEIDKEYYDKACKRITDSAIAGQESNMDKGGV